MVNTEALYISDAVPTGVTAAPITVTSTAVTYVNSAAINVTTDAASVAPSGGSAECGGFSCGLVVGGAVALAVIGIGAVITGLIIQSRRRKAEAEKVFRRGKDHCPTSD